VGTRVIPVYSCELSRAAPINIGKQGAKAAGRCQPLPSFHEIHPIVPEQTRHRKRTHLLARFVTYSSKKWLAAAERRPW
jgi:hypothetical protein